MRKLLQFRNNVTELLNVCYNFVNCIDFEEKMNKIIS